MSINLTSYNITGDCNNTSAGTYTFSFITNFYPITLVWQSFPLNYSITTGITFNSTINNYSLSGLPAGSYSFNLVNESEVTLSDTLNVNFLITSANTYSIQTFSNTTCGNNNGIINSSILLNGQVQTIGSMFSATTYLYKSNELYMVLSGGSNFSFLNLPADYYYATYTDFCGCSSTSNSTFIQSSLPLEFGLYTVNNPACLLNRGRIVITGLTGTPPYTYLWGGPVSGQTGNTVTGLTTNSYEVQVTDGNFCSSTKRTTVGTASTLKFITYETIQPSCNNSDGSITFYFEGGAAPFLYQLSNGQSLYSLSNQITFTGLSSGLYTCLVNDVGLCNASGTATLTTPQSFSVISLTSTPASCNSFGIVTLDFEGGTPPFTLYLSGTNLPVQSTTTFLDIVSFGNLNPGTYTISLTDSSNVCPYSSEVTVENTNHFTLSATTTGTTCGGNNGAIDLFVLNPYNTGLTFTYNIDGVSSVPTTSNFYPLRNLSSGSYNILVTDNENCNQSLVVNVSASTGPEVFLAKTSCTTGQNNGAITAYVKSTEGPFQINWSENVSGQTGIFITGLTEGIYVMSLSSSTGCQTTKVTSLQCDPIQFTSSTYNTIYTTGVVRNSSTSQLTLQTMFFSGFSSILSNSNAENCVLSSATFYVDIEIGGVQYNLPFYTTDSLTSVPDLSYFSVIIQNSVLSIPNIDSCIVNTDNQSIVIVAGTTTNSEFYAGESVSFSIIISYKIICNSINNVIC